jgi:hypothetical protein
VGTGLWSKGLRHHGEGLWSKASVLTKRKWLIVLIALCRVLINSLHNAKSTLKLIVGRCLHYIEIVDFEHQAIPMMPIWIVHDTLLEGGNARINVGQPKESN